MTSAFRFAPIPSGRPDRTTFEVFRGRRFYGHYHVFKTGARVYMALRHRSEVYRAGNGWAMDNDLVRLLRTRGCNAIGVDVVGDEAGEGERYVTQAHFYDPKHGNDFGGECDKSSARDTPQRFVRLEFFKRQTGLSIASKRYTDYAKRWRPKKAERWETDLAKMIAADEGAGMKLAAA